MKKLLFILFLLCVLPMSVEANSYGDTMFKSSSEDYILFRSWFVVDGNSTKVIGQIQFDIIDHNYTLWVWVNNTIEIEIKMDRETLEFSVNETRKCMTFSIDNIYYPIHDIYVVNNNQSDIYGTMDITASCEYNNNNDENSIPIGTSTESENNTITEYITGTKIVYVVEPISLSIAFISEIIVVIVLINVIKIKRGND